MTSAAYVSDDYFRALRMPLRAGRTFNATDRLESAGVVIVNDAFARQYFDNGQPLGRRISLAGRDREVVGVVGDVQVRPGWGNNGPLAAMPLAYIPVSQTSDGMLRLVHGWFAPAFVVRTTTNSEVTAAAIRRAVNESDPWLPLAKVRSLSDVQAASLAAERVMMILVAALAIAALLLSAVGIHGLIATSVAERTREMGIRLALGSSTSRALRTLALPGVGLASAGTVVGLLLAAAGAGTLGRFVWGISTYDPLTFIAVAVLLPGVASAASIAPAIRILRLDPATTLRQE
jgi:hypothetical protein